MAAPPLSLGGEKSSRSLYVGNLDPRVSEVMLGEIFSTSTSGKVVGVKLIPDKNNNGATSYGFVEFAYRDSAETAIMSLNGRKVFNHEMKVNWAYQGTMVNRPDISNHHHVFVGDLCPDVTEAHLHQAFSAFGSLSHVRVIHDVASRKSRGYGFLAFRERADAERAIKEMDKAWLGSKSIKVNWATQKTQHASNPGHYMHSGHENGMEGSSGAFSSSSSSSSSSSNSSNENGPSMNSSNHRRSRSPNVNSSSTPGPQNENGSGYGAPSGPSYGGPSCGLPGTSSTPTGLLGSAPHATQNPASMSHRSHSGSRNSAGSALGYPAGSDFSYSGQQNSRFLPPVPPPLHSNSYTSNPPQQQSSYLPYEAIITQSSPSNCTVYIGNLAPTVREPDLLPFFQSHGVVSDIRLQLDRGYAFVRLDSHERAAMAIFQLQNTMIHNRMIRVSWGKDKGNDRSGSMQMGAGLQMSGAAAASGVSMGQMGEQMLAMGGMYPMMQLQDGLSGAQQMAANDPYGNPYAGAAAAQSGMASAYVPSQGGTGAAAGYQNAMSGNFYQQQSSGQHHALAGAASADAAPALDAASIGSMTDTIAAAAAAAAQAAVKYHSKLAKYREEKQISGMCSSAKNEVEDEAAAGKVAEINSEDATQNKGNDITTNAQSAGSAENEAAKDASSSAAAIANPNSQSDPQYQAYGSGLASANAAASVDPASQVSASATAQAAQQYQTESTGMSAETHAAIQNSAALAAAQAATTAAASAAAASGGTTSAEAYTQEYYAYYYQYYYSQQYHQHQQMQLQMQQQQQQQQQQQSQS